MVSRDSNECEHEISGVEVPCGPSMDSDEDTLPHSQGSARRQRWQHRQRGGGAVTMGLAKSQGNLEPFLAHVLKAVFNQDQKIPNFPQKVSICAVNLHKDKTPVLLLPSC